MPYPSNPTKEFFEQNGWEFLNVSIKSRFKGDEEGIAEASFGPGNPGHGRSAFAMTNNEVPFKPTVCELLESWGFHLLELDNRANEPETRWFEYCRPMTQSIEREFPGGEVNIDTFKSTQKSTRGKKIVYANKLMEQFDGWST